MVNILCVFFRSPSFKTAFRLFGRVFKGGLKLLPETITAAFELPEISSLFVGKYRFYFNHIIVVIYIILSLGIVFFSRNNYEGRTDRSITVPKAIGTGILLAWCVLSFENVSAFLYFNF